MTSTELLAALEPLNHGDRSRKMASLGRQSHHDASVAETLHVLAGGGFYERLLVLLACRGSRDGAHVLRSLSDESRLLRSLAIRLAPTACTDTQLVEALSGLSRKARPDLLRSLLRRDRQAAIDAFIELLAVRDEEHLGEILAFGSAVVVERYLDRVVPRLGYDDWRRLSGLHPEIACSVLLRQAQSRQESDPRLLFQVNAVLPDVADTRPDQALALVREMLRLEPLARLTIQRLAERRPNEVADLLLASEDDSPIRLTDVAHRVSGERLLTLLEQRPNLFGPPASWLKRLRPELRSAAYNVAGQGWRTAEGILATPIIALLPGAAREEEARRHLALPALATRPEQRLPYATFLPWEEARKALDPLIGAPTPELRVAALPALIGVARYHSERLPEILALIRSRKNEQDPVRGAMLQALAALPPARWLAEHLEALGQIVRDALDAADLSSTTAWQAQSLVVALVPFYPDWAATWLATIARERGQMQIRGRYGYPSTAELQSIAPFLLPVFESWATREREHSLVQAATAFGRHLRLFEGFAPLLENLAMNTRQSHVASRALTLLRHYRRSGKFEAAVVALLESDPSTATLPPIYEHLHRRRQDLLNPYLGRQAYSGRFSTGRTRFVLPIQNGFYRWTPVQQETFARALTEAIRDADRDTPAVHQAIRQLSAMPAISPVTLLALATLEMPRAAVRDAALRALAGLDAGQGIPALIAAMSDERARIAIYALRSAVLEMPANRALALLQGVPTNKVTVAKEVIRLLGEIDSPDVLPSLLALDRPNLHRDVRVALLRALWDHTEKDVVWPLLNAAAIDPDPAVATGVVRIPVDRVSPTAQGRVLSLVGVLLQHPDQAVRLATLVRCGTLPLPDPNRTLLPHLQNNLTSSLPDESARAAFALCWAYGQEAVAIGTIIREVRSARRVLVTILSELRSVLNENRTRLRPTVQAVLDALTDDPLTARHRAELAIAGLPFETLASFLSQMAATGDLYPETLMAAVDALLQQSTRPDAATGLGALEAALAGTADERLRRLALAALVAQATGATGWTPAIRERLEGYRHDVSPLVAAAAQFTLPPPPDTTD